MADTICNVALGRWTEYYNRVKSADPATAGFKIILVAAGGVEADSVLRDKTDVAAFFAGTTNEATNTGAGRKTLVAADIAALTIDQANDRVDLDLPDQTWNNVQNDGTGAIAKVLVAYFANTGGADNTGIPLAFFDYAITPDGSSITAVIAAAGIFRAQQV